jgi:hypothetical protein
MIRKFFTSAMSSFLLSAINLERVKGGTPCKIRLRFCSRGEDYPQHYRYLSRFLKSDQDLGELLVAFFQLFYGLSCFRVNRIALCILGFLCPLPESLAMLFIMLIPGG